MEPVWRDADDEHLQVDLSSSDRLKKFISENKVITGAQYNEKLRAFYNSMHQPSWTQPVEGVDRKSLAGLLMTSKPVLAVSSHHLLEGTIAISQLPHANLESQSKACVSSVEFQEGLLLTAGLDKRLRLFRLDESRSVCEAVAYFKDLPITSAHFATGTVYVSGKRPFYYSFDLGSSTIHRVPILLGYEKTSLERMTTSPDSKQVLFLTDSGYIPFVSTQSQKVLFQLKMNAACLCVGYLSDTEIVTGGEEGDLYFWDLRTRRCLRRFHDEGNIKITTLSVSGKHIATGSTSGEVNLYDTSAEGYNNEAPSPIKSLLNLTTNVDGLQFNQTGEVLAMWSKWKRNALRLVHIPSLTVYSNWPDLRSNMQFPISAGFSEDSKYLSVGNDEGTALLYKLSHYSTD